MSKNLQPGDNVVVQVKSYMTRRGVFVRYVKRRQWPMLDDHERCLVQFRHNKLPIKFQSSLVRIERNLL